MKQKEIYEKSNYGWQKGSGIELFNVLPEKPYLKISNHLPGGSRTILDWHNY